MIYYSKPKCVKNREATVKYKVTVATSLIMVAKGPDAIAGSKLSFVNKKGRDVEMKTATSMLKNIEKPTISLNSEFCQPIIATKAINGPHAKARENATNNSLMK